jgi:hypothetical protein
MTSGGLAFGAEVAGVFDLWAGQFSLAPKFHASDFCGLHAGAVRLGSSPQ